MIYIKSTTIDDENGEDKTFCVTHPFHPLKGREFTLITIRQLWGDLRAYYYDEKAMLRSIPLCWTNLKPKDPYIIIADQRVPFRIVDLLELVEIVENLTKLIQKL
jgi:hypothetical protein